MARWLALSVLSILVLGLVSCGGGGDDDSDDEGSGDGERTSAQGSSSDRTDSSSGTGSLTVAGKDYTIDVETCEVSMGPGKLTVIAGSIEGEKAADFSASGIEKNVAIAVRFGETGYVAVGAEMKGDAKSLKWEGDLLDPANPAKAVKGSFSIKC